MPTEVFAQDEDIKTLAAAIEAADKAEEAAQDAKRIASVLRNTVEAMESVLKAEKYVVEEELIEFEVLETESQRAAKVLAETKEKSRTLISQAKAAQYYAEQASKRAERAIEETATLVSKRQEKLDQILELQDARTKEFSKTVETAFGLARESITQRKLRENDGTMVTVVCITYNHEKYIAQALDSFLMQKTTFPFKVFVGEDCGPDGTADIVREYAEQYPEIIVPFIREKNMGAQRNLIDLCQRATSPYIAFCEGDDYWIDEHKLQKQFDYMEQHRDIRVCFAKAEIDAPEDWFLNNYFKKNKEGKLIYPDCEPNHSVSKTVLTAKDFIGVFVAHTSTLFYRWNYDLKIPEWYYKGMIGDVPLFLMQLGEGKAAFIKDVVSVYRRSDVGVWMNTSIDEHFLKTRLDYLGWLEGMLSYYAENKFKFYPKIAIENRIKLEATNYLTRVLKYNSHGCIEKLFKEYPKSVMISLGAYISFYKDSRLLTGCYTWEGYKLLVRNKWNRNAIKPLVKLMLYIDKRKKKFNLWKQRLKNLLSIFCYWMFSLVPKKKNLWVFSGFNKKSYMDNSKYFYEYVLEYHPEIQAVWLTLDNNIYQHLLAEGKPVCKMRTAKCIGLLSRAAIAFTDHFRMSDYENFSGFNNGTKVVQLWHGVSLKTMKAFHLTTVKGVQFSDDILPQKGDGIFTVVKKRFKYFIKAPHRELMERYLAHVCTGPDNVDEWETSYRLRKDQILISGYPRTARMLQKSEEAGTPQRQKILYAPTYRWSPQKETTMIDLMLEALPAIDAYMEKIDGEFVIRLHPHTWRNYQQKISMKLQELDHILCDTEKEIYESLHTYTMVITDYSSIAYDFLLLDRPLIFLCYDHKDFVANENGLRHNYMQYSPGTKVFTWEDIPKAIEQYLIDPMRDSEWRESIKNLFFDQTTNTTGSPEIIFQEVMKRLNS